MVLDLIIGCTLSIVISLCIKKFICEEEKKTIYTYKEKFLKIYRFLNTNETCEEYQFYNEKWINNNILPQFQFGDRELLDAFNQELAQILQVDEKMLFNWVVPWHTRNHYSINKTNKEINTYMTEQLFRLRRMMLQLPTIECHANGILLGFDDKKGFDVYWCKARRTEEGMKKSQFDVNMEISNIYKKILTVEFMIIKDFNGEFQIQTYKVNNHINVTNASGDEKN